MLPNDENLKIAISSEYCPLCFFWNCWVRIFALIQCLILGI